MLLANKDTSFLGLRGLLHGGPEGSLEAFLDAQGAADDGVRSGKLADHVRQVKDHVTKLGNKSYWDALPASPEMVVLFLPAEAIYMAALERDASLIDYGVKMNVLIASPLTLIALLRAASFGWNQQRLTLNAEEISRLGKALHESVATMAEHLEDLRKRMDGTFSTFNKMVGSFENNVLVKARRFRELGAGSAKEIPVIDPLESQVGIDWLQRWGMRTVVSPTVIWLVE